MITFKPVRPYDGTLGIPTQVELDTGPTVTEESEQLVIDETRDELNTAGPVDGKLKNQKLFNYFTSCNNYNFSCVCVYVCVYVKQNSLHLRLFTF